ncbi:MAG: molybdate ABC transporter substrate-binding protein [Pseudomonadota bacterium]
MDRCLPLLVLAAWANLAHADDVQVAVAANFAGPMQKIAAQFERDTGHKAIVVSGATGKFYAQIKNGAPFEVLLSADDETPARLEKEGAALAGTRFTYAIGKLVLWSAASDVVDEHGGVLRNGNFKHLALANPKVAPYGAASVQTLTALGLLESLQAKFVQAENIAQAYQFVATGNAAVGFVAMSQVYEGGKLRSGSAWVVPATLHSPIRQDAVILQKGKGKPAAAALMKFLQSEPIRMLIKSHGYDL